MSTIQQDDLIESVAAALQYISYYHPADYIAHLARAYEREQSPAAKDAMAQILTNSKMSATGHRPICQDTGIVNVFLKVGMDVRWASFTGSLEDAINANTKALTKTNAALADMIRQAGSLVLSDNMRLGSTVAASGTAQVRAAASSYHREGDTTINQYIQSKAQTAADLARETRWEADKAKARKR